MDRSNRRPAHRATWLAAVLTIAATWVGLPHSVAAADAPNTCAGATTTVTNNAWHSGTIDTSTDVDWYRFSIATGTRALLTLGNLPADYDVYLYSDCSTLLASSNRSGRQFDEIYRSFAAGTYRVKVVGYLGAQATAPYALRLRTLPWGIRILSSTTWTDAAGYLHVAGEVLNNTGESRRWIEIDASLRDASGAVLASAVAYSKNATMAPWSRSPFEIVARKPSGYARVTLVACTPTSTGGCSSGAIAPAPLGGISVAQAPSYLDTAGRRHYVGSVVNSGTGTARLARAVVTAYNAAGTITGLAAGFSSPSSIAAGGKAPYDIPGSGTSAPNRYVTVATATSTGCTSSPRYTGGQENLVPPLSRASATGRVALTFDMGGRMTPAVRILQLLVANNVCATIFPTGAISRTAEGQAALAVVKAHPELFELGNHTMNHCDLVRGGGGAPGAAEATYCNSLAPTPTEAEVKQELIDGDTWIRAYTGMPTAPLWRAPYGALNLDVRTWAAEAGWTKHVKWDIDTIDWRPIADGGPTARSMTLKVVNGATSGSIVLMHLGGYETLDALQSMIDGLRARGFTLTTVSDMAQ
jgi:peptidoglycan/xylan/chitin deacetylase (PgdA/CDA1 family)